MIAKMINDGHIQILVNLNGVTKVFPFILDFSKMFDIYMYIVIFFFCILFDMLLVFLAVLVS